MLIRSLTMPTSTVTGHLLSQTAAAAAAAAAVALRGGNSADGAVLLTGETAMNRIKMRLEGLSSYGVLSALMMNACMRLFSATDKNLESGKLGSNIAKVVFCISVISSIMAACYTTVIFSLLGLYCRTALGMGRDQPFWDFFNQTTKMRETAFDAFLVSLITFETSFVTSIYINYKGPLRKFATAFASACALFSFYHWGWIIRVAGKLLFSRR